MTFIAKCKCEHAYQDKVHGKGMRVYNLGSKESKCTVCGNKIANVGKGDK